MRLKFDLSPRPVLVTGVVFILYLVLWVSTAFIQSGPPKRPSNADIRGMGFDLDAASQDLKTIASPSRPYNSRQNEVVRRYILSRLQPLKDQFSFVNISMDQDGGAYWYDGDSLTYFESTNVLFMISGTRTDLKSMMFGAHYDTVATSYGATSSALGVVTLLQLAAYFTAHRPSRTVILNFGNGEEDGLHGSRSFLLHPWAQTVKSFINLEGFGSGGRPVVFRTSSYRLTRAFRALPHTHGSALSSDAFPARMTQNSTSFSIYNAFGMVGIDLAFYQRRNRYHTFTDSIDSLSGLGGKEGALWSMLSNAWGASLEVDADQDSDPEVSGRTVYFDVFGGNMAVFTANSLFAGNIALLVIGPLVLLTAYTFLLRSPRYRVLVEWIIEDSMRGWGRFWLSFGLCVALTLGFSLVHSAANPFIIASRPNIVVLCIFSLSLCSFCAPLYLLGFFRPLPASTSISRQTTQTFLSLYAVWWIALLIATVLLRAKKTGGLYFFTFFNAFALAAALIDLGAGVLDVTFSEPVQDDSEVDEPLEVLSRSTHEAPPTSPRSHIEKIDQALWTRSLGLHHETVAQEVLSMRYGLEPWMAVDRYGFWLVEMIISLFFPVLLVMQLCLLLVNALSGTLVEGSSPTTVYLLLGAMIICTVLPLAPIAHRIHPLFYISLFLIFVATVIYGNVTFPFTAEDKFKLFWSQSLSLDNGLNKVEMVGLERYLPDIATRMTSTTNSTGFSEEHDQVCGDFKCYKQLWDGPALNIISNVSTTTWMNATVTRINTTSAQFFVRAERSKNCRFTFDKSISSLNLTSVTSATPIPFHPSFPLPKGGTTKITLWTRTESRNITAVVAWDPSVTGNTDETSMVTNGQNVPRKVRVSCYHDDVARGKIPALDQTLDRAPEWVSIIGRQPLVEIYKEFQL